MNLKNIILSLLFCAASSCGNAQTSLSKFGPGVQVVQIDLSNQYVRIWQDQKLQFESHISSGRPWMPTPTGVTHIGTTQDPEKVPLRPLIEVEGNLRWCVPFGFTTPDGTSRAIFAHEGTVYEDAGVQAAYPASHGCIRLPKGKAKEFYDLIRKDTVVEIYGDAWNYFNKHFAGAKYLRVSADGKLLGWKWNPKNGPDADFVELATALQSGQLRGAICPWRKDMTYSGQLNDLVIGFEFFGSPHDKVNVWDLGIPVPVYNKTVQQYNAQHPAGPRLKQITYFIKRS